MKSNTKPQVDHNRTQCGILHKANNSKEKAKTEQFCCEAVLEPNTKKLDNSPSFPSILIQLCLLNGSETIQF
jgi:hypothetical protein